ncbi:general substrate transporter [Mytilinidion resinicola]|uniref:General substrate transporter n=1 Tax=Mytilinidion resinicola TaxID=574789 RepID=A0A6A6Y1E0_9PEZI|nr:general substrate transporter [Mytilinidion resinicola]KAF2802333.1 general substrate transporter [Mytilinidion resinicola]
MEAPKDEKRRSHFQKRLVLIVFGVCWGSTAFGFASAIIATTLGQPSFKIYMNLTTTNPNTAKITGAMNSLFYAGGFFGSVFNAWYADRFGRKTSIMTACVIMVIAAALCAGSVHVAMFIVFRFCTGWSCLMLLISVPLWIIEVVPPGGRGVFGNIHGLMAVFGYLIASYVGVGFFYYQNGSGNQWRAPLAFACLPPLITLSFMPWVPESPRWLLVKGQSERAWKIVESLHRSSDDPEGDYAKEEFQQMQRQIELDSQLDSSWKILVTRPSYRKRAYIACSLLTFIYSSGTLTISNYGPTLFAELGYKPAQTLQFQAGIILCSISALTVSLFVVDRIPRNIILAVGMIAVAVPLAGEAAMTSLYVGTTNKSGLAAGVAFLYIYIFLYGIFLDGPGYFYANEIFPTHLRSKGATLCVASYSLINIMWTQVSPIAFRTIHWKFYMVFICCCVASSIIMYLYFPDTLGKPLEEVARIFGDDDLVAHYERAGIAGGSISHGSEHEKEKQVTTVEDTEYSLKKHLTPEGLRHINPMV